MSARPRIAVVGSVNVDLVARCRRLPRPGETVTGATLERLPGGKGANQALAARRLGADVRLVARVGDDELAGLALALLEASGVELAVSVDPAAPTGTAIVLVAEDGENEIVVAPGANARLTPELADVAAFDAVLCQLEVPLETVAEAARRCTGLFCLNAAPALPVPADLLARTDLLIVNAVEAAALGPLVDSARLVAVTLGADGAVLRESGREIARAQPPAVQVVDTVGAGDAFCAALVVGLLDGRPLGAALARACAAGALAASRPGAQPALPTAAELDG
jgi:ribokinase